MLHISNEEGNTTNRYKRPKNSKSEALKTYKITNKLISEWFDYNSQQSFNSSSAKKRILRGIDRLIKHIELNKGK